MSNYGMVIARLEKLSASAKGDDNKLRTALIRVGSVLEAETKLNIRRWGMVDTGRLINSIRYQVNELSGNKMELSVGSYGVDYAAMNEYGGKVSKRQIRAMFANFRGRPKRAGKGVIKFYGDGSAYWRARPFLRPAINKHRKFMLDLIRQAYLEG